MNTFFWVCLGGAIGTGLRYLLGLAIPLLLGCSFPYATLLVNVGGSFLMGLVMFWGIQTQVLSPVVRLTLTTGLLGGLTTYSSFNYETLELLQQGAWRLGGLNLLLHVVLGLMSGMAGLGLGQWLAGSRL